MKEYMSVWKKYNMSLVAAGLGAICFVLIYGLRVLDPTYDDWLLRGGDLTQHYIGWEFFRSSEWKFPIGLMDRISYPNDVSVIFTDSIPVFAVIFKAFSPILPTTFQYFGWWELLCFILQAVYSAKLLYCFTRDKVLSVFGSILFVVAPVFITRVFFHTALSSQWLLLVTMYFAIEYIADEKKSLKKGIVFGGILGLLCGSIHMYYIPMCGIVILGFLLDRILREKKWKPILYVCGSYVICAGIMVLVLGGFSHRHQLDAGGLGQFSFNMNGFINSMGWSRVLAPLSAYGEGYGDGFAYLGLGVLVLLVADFGLLIFRILKGKVIDIKGKNYIAYGFIMFVSHVTENQDILYGVSQYAYLHGMTVNDFYLAHSAAIEDIEESREEGLDNLREDTIYVFKQQDQLLCEQYELDYMELDGIVVGIKEVH